MKRALFWIMFMACGAVSAQDPGPVGLWHTHDQDGEVEIAPCDEGLCGRIVGGSRDGVVLDVNNKDPALRTRPLKGVMLFSDLKGGPPSWNGRIYNPADGDTYDATLTMSGADTLKLRGCIVWPLCKVQEWRRITR